MFRLIIMFIIVIYCWKKFKKFVGKYSIESFRPSGDTVTITEYEEIESNDGRGDNLEELKELKQNLKKLIRKHLNKDDIGKAMSLLSQLQLVNDEIEDYNTRNNLSKKVKNISEKILNKVDSYLQ